MLIIIIIIIIIINIISIIIYIFFHYGHTNLYYYDLLLLKLLSKIMIEFPKCMLSLNFFLFKYTVGLLASVLVFWKYTQTSVIKNNI